MPHDNVYETLTNILKKVGVPADKITPTAELDRDLGVDSLSMLEVAVSAEDNLGIRVDDGDLANLHTVNDAAEYLRQRTPA